MLSLKYIFAGSLLLYLVVMVFLLNISFSPNCPTPNQSQGFLKGNEAEMEAETKASAPKKKPATKAKPKPKSWDYTPYRLDFHIKDISYFNDKTHDPFYYLGAFDPIPGYTPRWPERQKYGVIKDPTYCTKTDLYNLYNPANMFDTMNFYTDHFHGTLYRREVMRTLGKDLMKDTHAAMPKNLSNSHMFDLRPDITTFHMMSFNYHNYHKIGEHFLCPTQMYNHIPGHEYLAYKDRVTDSVIEYSQKYENQPQCFSKDRFFLSTYRLHHADECRAFFDKINSEEYRELIKTEPLQFILKIGHGVHASLGVFLLDAEEEAKLRTEYGDHGENCGKITKSLLAQKYLGNPLLVNVDKKIDFRAYLLVASNDPLIAYYHEGVARVSLHAFNKSSTDRSIHITNTHMTDDELEEAKKAGKTKEEIDAIYFNCEAWMFSTLQQYLFDTGKIVDPNWLENSFRPQIKKIMLHMLRMSEKHLVKMPNVYELYAIDLMIDDNLNVWFIECNTNPQLTASTEEKHVLFLSMLKGMFEIQYNFYRSRMKRYLLLLHDMYHETETTRMQNLDHWKARFIEASKNRLEPEFQISPKNSWVPFIDRTKEGAEAYYGLLPEECLDEIETQ